jgi:hypothetical protein
VRHTTYNSHTHICEVLVWIWVKVPSLTILILTVVRFKKTLTVLLNDEVVTMIKTENTWQLLTTCKLE